MTIQQAKINGIKTLKASPSPELDCDCLLQFVTKKNKTFLLFHRDTELTPSQITLFQDSLKQRETGLPIAYITGEKEFFGRNFYVNPDVLIPKPDTETLIEEAISILEKLHENNNKTIKIADICTGSGCIAITIALEALERNIPIEITATDISEKALTVAKKNCENLLAENKNVISFFQGDLFCDINENFDLILTNPPYIPSNEVDELLKDGRNEPRLALDGDEQGSFDGLGIIRRLIPQIKAHLVQNGCFIMETGEYNAEEAAKACEMQGLNKIHILKDLSNQLRDVIGYK
ncbi:MAG: peptide chain release factor N(5)-glutamine methyltransferase [Treponema sp.]|nr:peptide chain release factor N(5)-glutamine methyltransferase [Treponema sp.]